MSHVRTQIRDAVVTALADIEATVYASRYLPIEEPDLPALLVYTNTESIVGDDLDHLTRTIDLVVEIVVQAQDIDAEVDALLVGIEQALNAETLGGLVMVLLPANIEVSMRAEGAQPVGRARVTFQATYRTAFADPELSI